MGYLLMLVVLLLAIAVSAYGLLLSLTAFVSIVTAIFIFSVTEGISVFMEGLHPWLVFPAFVLRGFIALIIFLLVLEKIHNKIIKG
jgi:hypothetical protein